MSVSGLTEKHFYHHVVILMPTTQGLRYGIDMDMASPNRLGRFELGIFHL